MTYSAQALALDFQFELDRFFERLDVVKADHDAPDSEIISLLELRASDMDDQYRTWIEDGE